MGLADQDRTEPAEEPDHGAYYLAGALLAMLLAVLSCCGLGGRAPSPPDAPTPSSAEAPHPTQTSRHKTAPVESATAPRPRRALAPVRPNTPITLENGLTIYIVEDHTAPTIAAHLVVRVGAANEEPRHAGIAHLLEHLMFKGTERLGTLSWRQEEPLLNQLDQLYAELAHTRDRDERAAIKEALQRVHAEADPLGLPNEPMRLLSALGGAHANAATSLEYTEYKVLLPADALEPWARFEADRFANPVFRNFGNERDVVVHELAERSNHLGKQYLRDFREAAFGDHPYGYPIGGSERSLSRITPEDLYAFHNLWYTPANAAIVLVGDVNTQDALGILEEAFGPIAARTSPTPAIPDVLALKTPTKGPLRDPPHFGIAWPLPAPEPEDYLALRVAMAVLEYRLRDKPWVIDVSPSIQRFRRGGLLTVTGRCRAYAHSDCARTVQQELRWMAQHPPSKRSLSEAALLAETHELEQQEDPSTRAHLLATSFVLGEPPPKLFDLSRELAAVTPKHVADAVERYLVEPESVTPDKSFVASSAYTSMDGHALASRSGVGSSAFYDELLAIPRPSLDAQWLQAGEDYSVDRDGRVIAAVNPYNHLFQAELVWATGWRADPMVCNALAHVLDNKVVDGGTPSIDRGHWVSRLDRNAVTVSSTCVSDEISVRLKGPEQWADDALQLALEALREPSFEARRDVQWRGDLRYATSIGSALFGSNAELELRPHWADLENPTSSRLYQALSALGPPQAVLYAGSHDAGWVARRVPVQPRAPLPQLTAYQPSSPQLVRVSTSDSTYTRWSEPYSPEHAALYALYDAYLESGTGVVNELLRDALGATYTPITRYERGLWRGDANYVHVRFTTGKSELPTVFPRLMETLSRKTIAPDRWDRVLREASERAWTEHIGFREASRQLWAWRKLGHDGDPRERIYDDLQLIEREDFEHFLASEARFSPVVRLPRTSDDAFFRSIAAYGDIVLHPPSYWH